MFVESARITCTVSAVGGTDTAIGPSHGRALVDATTTSAEVTVAIVYEVVVTRRAPTIATSVEPTRQTS